MAVVPSQELRPVFWMFLTLYTPNFKFRNRSTCSKEPVKRAGKVCGDSQDLKSPGSSAAVPLFRKLDWGVQTVWLQGSIFVVVFHLSRGMSNEKEHVLFPSIFFRNMDLFVEKSFLLCSQDPIFRINKNRILTGTISRPSCSIILPVKMWYHEASQFS